MKKFSISESTNNYLSKVAVFGVFLSLVLGLTTFPIFDNQEAINILVAQNILTTGEWLVPEGLQHPPLFHWFLAWSIKMFGIGEFSARIFSALFMFFTYLTLFFHVNRFDRQLGLMTLIVFAGNLAVGLIANVGLHFSMLLFFSTTMVIGIHRYILYQRPGWLVLISFMLSLALLTEGPAILPFVAIFSLVLGFIHPKGIWVFKLKVLFSLLMALVPFLLWCYVAETRSPGYVLDFISRNGYIWTFKETLDIPFFRWREMLILIFAFLPFAVFIPLAILRTVRVFGRKGAPKQFFAIWAICASVPYLVLGGKIAWMAILSFPAFSVIVASIVHDWSRQVRPRAIFLAPIAQSIILGITLIVTSSTMLVIMKKGSWQWIQLPGIILSLGALLILLNIRKSNGREKYRRWWVYGLVATIFFWASVPHAFRHHWGAMKYMVKSTKKKYDVVFVNKNDLDLHPSLHVYLLRYQPENFYILQEDEIPFISDDSKAAWIQPVVDDMPPGTHIYRGNISGGVGEIQYGVVPIYPKSSSKK